MVERLNQVALAEEREIYKEKERIANILSDIDNEIFTLEEKLHKSKSIKQGMMQNLLTGKIRLV